MYALIDNVLKDNRFQHLSVSVHVPLKMIIRNFTLLTENEKKYVSNTLSHVDFLVFDTFGKTPQLAIEVDGVAFHRNGTKQALRDKMKKKILSKYGLPLLRFRTDGSNKRKILIKQLESLLNC